MHLTFLQKLWLVQARIQVPSHLFSPTRFTVALDTLTFLGTVEDARLFFLTWGLVFFFPCVVSTSLAIFPVDLDLTVPLPLSNVPVPVKDFEERVPVVDDLRLPFCCFVSSNFTSSPTVSFLSFTNLTIQSGISPFFVFSGFGLALCFGGGGVSLFFTSNRCTRFSGALRCSDFRRVVVGVPGATNFGRETKEWELLTSLSCSWINWVSCIIWHGPAHSPTDWVRCLNQTAVLTWAYIAQRPCLFHESKTLCFERSEKPQSEGRGTQGIRNLLFGPIWLPRSITNNLGRPQIQLLFRLTKSTPSELGLSRRPRQILEWSFSV